MKKNILVTGGAGFIGSNIVGSLIRQKGVGKIRVLDDLSTGFYANIADYVESGDVEFVHGDIRDFDTCQNACEDMHLICHQAALGSVPRSIKDPLATHAVNATGTLHVFTAAKERGIKRVVFAASSSTYGDSENMPKVEHIIGKPLSPYAVTKLLNEIYADVFSKTYGMEYIGLRYFNVYGPKQDPDGAYAAVIPLFFKAAICNQAPLINGDGSNSRDFTYVDNAVEANLLALFTDDPSAVNQIYNVACGEQTDLNQLWQFISRITGSSIEPLYGPARNGDIPHSLADISKIKKALHYNGSVRIEEGLRRAYDWYTARHADLNKTQ